MEKRKEKLIKNYGGMKMHEIFEMIIKPLKNPTAITLFSTFSDVLKREISMTLNNNN